MPDPGRGSRWSIATVGVAVAIGTVAAIAALVLLDGPFREWRRDRMRPVWIAAISGSDPAARREAWNAVEGDLESGTAIGARVVDDLDGPLATPEGIPDAALVEAAQRLHAFGLWTWDARPSAAVARSIELLAAAPLDRIAIERLLDRPSLRSLPVGAGVVEAVWARAGSSDRAALLESLARVGEPVRADLLDRLDTPDDGAVARRLVLLRAPVPGPSRDTDSEADLAVAWELASDPTRSPATRRLALARLASRGRLDEVPETVRGSIERGSLAGPGEPALAAALLAEASEGAGASRRTARRIGSWLTSVDPARRAAGVLLHALAGRDPAVRERLRRIAALRRDEDDRRSATLAAAALVLDPTATAPDGVGLREEFLHRVSPRGTRLDPDLLALRLAAGEEFAVDQLLEHGVAADPPELAALLERALLERFCPELADLDLTDRDAALAAWWRLRSDPNVAFDPRRRRWSRTRSL